MRIRTLFLAIPIGLLPVVALAQTPPATPAPAGAQAPAAAPAAPAADDKALPTTYGSVDFGIRGTTTTGDAARYERYRDMGNGLFLETGRYNTLRNGWMIETGADHVGRKDQRYFGSAIRPGTLKLFGQWDQIPMLMSRTTQTLFLPNTPLGVLEIDNAIQQDVQANAANLSKYANNPQYSRTFEMSSRRHILTGGAEFIAKNGLTLDLNLNHINREGNIPYGGSFGHSNVVETIAPVHHQTTSMDTSAEYAKGNLIARGGYTGSWFHNDSTSLTFDNPWRATDISGTSSRGRLSLAPSNSFVGVNGTLSYKLPYKSRATFYASTGSLRDVGDPLLPHTVNSALAVVPLERTTTEGHATTSSFNVNFTSRPTQLVDIDVKFRSYDYNNKTPEFMVTQRVGYDNSISAVTNPALQETEPFGVKRTAFDSDVRFNVSRAFTTGVGYSHAGEDRTHRIFEEVNDNTFRLEADSVGSHLFTLRSKYEHTQRRGVGDKAEIAAELTAIGEQPGMRHLDVASRNRDRVTFLGSLVPSGAVSFTGSFAAGKDDYLESEFGLRDNNNQLYSAGMEYAPSEYAGAGISYSYERYTSLSRSRQADNATQAADPSRNWATDASDQAHSIIAHGEMLKIKQHLDVFLTADYNNAKGTYHYITGAVVDRTLPEEVVLPSTLPPPTQLPDVKSQLTRVNLDTVYSLSERWSLGFSVWYEKYRVEDFALDANSLNPTGALLLGYQYNPYDATTFWGRAVYKF